ncbi:MAG: hypothetical protein NVS1B11_29590 [Terriglobales bacterium]
MLDYIVDKGSAALDSFSAIARDCELLPYAGRLVIVEILQIAAKKGCRSHSESASRMRYTNCNRLGGAGEI